MNIMAVVGSSRDGNSKYLIEESIKLFEDMPNICVEIVYLKNLHMHFCNGCLNCDTSGKCVFDDDMSQIVSKARETDVFIFATPARWGLLSGELKTFMDRLNPLAINEELSGKKAIVFAVGQSGEEEKESIIYAAQSVEMFCKNAGIEIIREVIVCGCYSGTDVQHKQQYVCACKDAVADLIK